ncbi:MAG: hypothetical protein PT120_02685 [Aphanizomenon gracile PMC649.10]|jgi:hypothetical protein|nr:hypothetical protein [Aphanizomenon gracile PMC638.10]MDM3853844.1 hypothetical protein [Aphanizomenon gracile PMC649.10]
MKNVRNADDYLAWIKSVIALCPEAGSKMLPLPTTFNNYGFHLRRGLAIIITRNSDFFTKYRNVIVITIC